MKNPFIFGKAVAGEHFINREKEIDELKSTLLSGQHVVLFSPRKIGKTSLIKETFLQIKDAVCIQIDLWQVTSTYTLAKEIINSVVNKSYTSIERLGHDLKDLFKSLRPKVNLDMDGHIGVEFSRADVKDALKDALDFPEKVAQKKGIKLIIAFDEFQEIEHINGLEMEKLFRSVLQHHENVSYIFAGSEKSLINIIFNQKVRPFYRFAKIMELKPIESNVLKSFISNKFAGTGKKIDKDAVEWIVEFSNGIPYYVQHICHEIWYLTKKDANMQIVEKALEEQILPAISGGFNIIWNRIKSIEQRNLLIGLANEEHPQIYSRMFIEKYELKSPGHIGKAVKSMEGIGLIERNKISDIFFREWVKRNFSF